MDNATFRKNVFKTLSVKPAKLGLRNVAKNTNRTNIMHASIGIATEAMELVVGLGPYLLGSSKLTDTMKVNAFEEMGDLGYYLAVLAKSLKFKLPSSSKKVRLKGMTRSEAVLQLLEASSLIGDVAKKNFYGPVMKKRVIERVLDIKDAKSGAVVSQETHSTEVDVVDPEATDAQILKRDERLRELLTEKFIPLYWALCYDMFEVPPANVFVGNIAKLAKRYGEGFFQLSEAEDRDTEAEMDEMTTAAAA